MIQTWRKSCMYTLKTTAHFCTAVSVALVRSMSPPVGLSTSPTNPLPVPFTNPHKPSFLAPAKGGKLAKALEVRHHTYPRKNKNHANCDSYLLLAVSQFPSLLQRRPALLQTKIHALLNVCCMLILQVQSHWDH